MKPIRFQEWDCDIELGRYNNGRPALILNDAHDGEQVAVATVNLQNEPVGDNEVFIKNYSENEGILEALVSAGVVKATGGKMDSNFVEIHRVELLPPYRERSHLDDLLNKSADRDEERSESRDMER
jgi:hypothetical protein